MNDQIQTAPTVTDESEQRLLYLRHRYRQTARAADILHRMEGRLFDQMDAEFALQVAHDALLDLAGALQDEIAKLKEA